MLDFPTALETAKRRLAAHPFWPSAYTGTPLANDIPVICAELMRDAYRDALCDASALAKRHAQTYENDLAGGLVDSGLAMKAAEANQLASEVLALAIMKGPSPDDLLRGVAGAVDAGTAGPDEACQRND